MMKELDNVVLVRDIVEQGLKQGDVGAVVHCYPDNQAFEVEFITGQGKTIAVLTLTQSDIRLIASQEILHVRAIEPA